MANFNLIVSDLHHRISGVSATVRAIVPSMLDQQALVLVSQHRIDGAQQVSLKQLLKLTKTTPKDKPCFIWHVRRNNEMTWALIFKYLFRRNIHIVFTSAAIRRHSWWPRKLIAAMDTIIATSEKAAAFMPKVAKIVPHGVNTDVFCDLPVAEHFDPEFVEQNCYVGIIGRVRPEKGTDLFVNAMIGICLKHAHVKAVIVGKATAKFQSFANELKQKIEIAGVAHQFIWLDEIAYEQMPAVYQALDVVVCPAKYEGFGLVPLEAGACGCAVVATRTGAYEEIIKPDETGYLVDIGDQAGVTQALCELLEQPELLNNMQSQAPQHVSENFSLANEINGISSVYQQIWSQQEIKVKK